MQRSRTVQIGNRLAASSFDCYAEQKWWIIQLVDANGNTNPATPKAVDDWCNNLKDQITFVPAHVYHTCVSMINKDGVLHLIVKRAPVLITTDTHMYTRGLAENASATPEDVAKIMETTEKAV